MSEQQKEYKIEGRPATIFRTVKNKDNPYVMIDRRPIDNPALSFKAKGILTYLLSRPDGWEVSITDLVRHGQEGEAAIRSGMKELREIGHMTYETSRKDGRITGWLIRVFEVPQMVQVSPDSDFQEVENLHVENQEVENRTQVLKTLSTTDLKKDITQTEKILKSADLKVDAILEAGRQSASKSWTLLPEIFQPLAEAFCIATTLRYKKQFASDWMATISDWLDDGYTPQMVTIAVKDCLSSGMSTTRPGSIEWKLRDLKAKQANQQQDDGFINTYVPEPEGKIYGSPPEEMRKRIHAMFERNERKAREAANVESE